MTTFATQFTIRVCSTDPNEVKLTWNTLFESTDASPVHNLDYVCSRALGTDAAVYYVIAECDGASITTAFSVKDDLGTCILEENPFLHGGLLPPAISPSLSELASGLGVKNLYFPLVYNKSFFPRAHFPLAEWPRLPSPIIEPRCLTRSLWETVEQRVGSQARRRRHRFEREKFDVRDVFGQEAVEAVAAIEQRSWKRTRHQDMVSRSQFSTFRSLIENRLINVRVAFDDIVPIAYRLSIERQNHLVILKWSFDEAYRQFSPGFYLLTADLSRTAESYSIIDLWGSPDTLKQCLETGIACRTDFGWPLQSKRIEEIKEERLEHDASLSKILTAGKGIRHAYVDAKC